MKMLAYTWDVSRSLYRYLSVSPFLSLTLAVMSSGVTSCAVSKLHFCNPPGCRITDAHPVCRVCGGAQYGTATLGG